LVYRHRNKNSLFIKLAERLIHIEPGIESYLRRPPFIDDLTFVDETGGQLEFEISTSPELLEFKTLAGNFFLAFQNLHTLAFGLPDLNTTGVRFRINSTHLSKNESGGWLGHVRNIAYSVKNGKVAKNQMDDSDNGLTIEFIVQAEQDCSITIQIANDADYSKNDIPFSTVRQLAKERWENWFASAPRVSEKYRQKYAYAWWVMANNLISPSGYVKYEAMMPTKAFYVGIWLWDSALHAIAFRHIDPELARNQIRVMLEHQLDDGMLPDVVFDEGVVTEIDHPIQGRVTKPPILAWAALKIHETDPNVDFLREIYKPLTRWNAWWLNHNNSGNDLAQYSHPYSSGLDDSPLWDFGMPVKSPDINTYLYIQMNSLSRIADLIEKPREAEIWKKKASELLDKMIKYLWDEEVGIFRAKHNKTSISVNSPFNLYPLWTGCLPQEIANRLLTHLMDPTEFWGEFGLPTVAYNDSLYEADKMWRGPVWANINYFFVEALQKIGEQQLANELRDKTLSLIARQLDIREYYNSQTGEPPLSAAPIFGWSAAVFIDLAVMEYAAHHKKETEH